MKLKSTTTNQPHYNRCMHGNTQAQIYTPYKSFVNAFTPAECICMYRVQMFNTNVVGLIAMTSAFVPHMRTRGCGHIINIGSISGHHTYPGGYGYGYG